MSGVLKKYFLLSVFSFIIFVIAAQQPARVGNTKTIIIKSGVESNYLSPEWKMALTVRMSQEKIDSFAAVRRSLTTDEIKWKELIHLKAVHWNSLRDSLAVPFNNLLLADTVFVLTGFLGNDDGFTWNNNTVCFDVTALNNVYGDAAAQENNERIDRIFAHEYTHLLHKRWAAKVNYRPASFKEEILWECWYEGMGMYRSLTAKWKPVNGIIPAQTQESLHELYPLFAEKMRTLKFNPVLTENEKMAVRKGLSRGPVNKKWGAFPVAIWLLLEADGDDRKLVKWIDMGPDAVLILAKKYLPGYINLK